MRKRSVGWTGLALALAAGAVWAGPAGAQATPEEPFAVTSRGRPLPRGERTVVVVRDSAAVPPAPAAAPVDSARRATRPAPVATAPANRTAAGAGSTATGAPPARTPPSTRTAAAAPAARTHVVAYGETFYGIANRYGVTAAALRTANPAVDQERLVTGTTLRIPAPTTAAAAPAAATRARSAPAPKTHRVVAGESLWGIARRYEVSMEAIRRANDLDDERVRTGQTLVIPEAD